MKVKVLWSCLAKVTISKVQQIVYFSPVSGQEFFQVCLLLIQSCYFYFYFYFFAAARFIESLLKLHLIVQI